MQNRYSYLVKNTGILAISNFSSKILAFLLVPLYTRVLTTEEYGSYDLISITIQLLIPIFTVNICEAVVRYLMDKNIEENDVITIGAKYCCIGLILFIVVAICNRITNLVPLLNNYVIMTIALFFSTVLYQYTSSIATIEFDEDILNGTQYSEINDLILASDFLITDYSSCMFDGMIAGKKVLIYASDIADYAKERGYLFDLENLPFSVSTTTKELIDNIGSFNEKEYTNRVDIFRNSLGLVPGGNASEDVADFLIAKMK